jgi:hypothetical protein
MMNCFLHYSAHPCTLKMQTAGSPKMLLPIYQTTRYYTTKYQSSFPIQVRLLFFVLFKLEIEYIVKLYINYLEAIICGEQYSPILLL